MTGASDGIGKEYAIQLARRGFNVALVARNKEKLDAVAQEVQQENTAIQTKTIVFDFSSNYSAEAYQTLFDELLQIDDVSILVNNVGVAFP